MFARSSLARLVFSTSSIRSLLTLFVVDFVGFANSNGRTMFRMFARLVRQFARLSLFDEVERTMRTMNNERIDEVET